MSTASLVTLTWTPSTSSRAACSGPRFSARVPTLNPNTELKNLVLRAESLTAMAGDRRRERSRCRQPRAIPRGPSLREREQFQRVAIVVTELERGHASGAVRQP
jgi:hypothetical protein